VAVATAGARVINLLKVSAPQQVMLEVKVAEVSRTLLDKLGSQFNWTGTSGSWAYSIVSDFFGSNASSISGTKGPGKLFSFDAEKQDGLIKILAEPTIVAISGQEGSFLAGGKIFIPTASTSAGAGSFPVITLTEKEFGVGLKFTPTVLDGGLINLKVAPEVSELSQTGSPFTTINGVTSVLPSFTMRRSETTIQLHDGQSFVISGLIKSNVTETVKRFPILGEIPVLGALFRSSEFQTDKTELMFLVTARLVKPVSQEVALPTDSFIPPTRGEFFLEGKMEGSAPQPKAEPQPLNPPQGKGGFEVK
jgi:pilus assembly protein CpaC